MRNAPSRTSFGGFIYVMGLALAGTYFTFASLQGDFGLFNRIQIEAEADSLRETRDELAAEIAVLENKTRRMSDDYLDLDLLDEQARKRLGLVRADEIVLR